MRLRRSARCPRLNERRTRQLALHESVGTSAQREVVPRMRRMSCVPSYDHVAASARVTERRSEVTSAIPPVESDAEVLQEPVEIHRLLGGRWSPRSPRVAESARCAGGLRRASDLDGIVFATARCTCRARGGGGPRSVSSPDSNGTSRPCLPSDGKCSTARDAVVLETWKSR